MRVALVCLCRFGGTLLCGRKLAAALAKLGDLDLMYIGSRDAVYEGGDALDRTDVPKLLVSSGKGKMGNLLQSLNPLNYGRILGQVRRFSPDVVHFVTTHAWHMVLIPALRRYVSVCTIHDPVMHLGAESRFYAGLTGIQAALADRAIVLSEALRASLCRFGKPESKVEVVPLGELGSDGAFQEVPRRGQILFLGRFEHYKGIDLLVDAFRVVKKKHPEFSLLVAGRGELTSKLAALGPSDGIRVCNRWLSEEEVNRFCVESDGVVLPYLEATQSGVAAKAQALGRPVIVTKVGGLPEQIEDGITGYAVPPNDAVALAQAMERLLLDRERLSLMGSAAWKLYHQKYGWPAIASETVEVYRRARMDRLTFGASNVLTGIKALWVGVLSRR
jgi:glycosyltransferase involved in cell wall biosynthesis